MKKRTVIGVVCIVAALIVAFLVAPLVNQFTTDTKEICRLKTSVTRGTEITNNHLEIVKVKWDTVPAGVITDVKLIVGKYAASNLYAGDYLTAAKLTSSATSADDVFAAMGDKVAISIPISSFAGGLSGKLQNGDIVRFYVADGDGSTYVPGVLQYVQIVTTTTGNGIDQDEIIENEDGSYSMPSTVTILANNVQAKYLADIAGKKIHLALVYRGDAATAKTYLDKQELYFSDDEDDYIFDDFDINDDNELSFG